MTNKKSILITRPLGQAQSLIDSLSSIGYLVNYRPMLEIKKIEPKFRSRFSASSDTECFRHIIFVSPNAVRFGLPYLQKNLTPLIKSGVFYAIGSATAELLKNAGLEPIFPELEMNSEGLLKLDSLLNVKGEKILLIKGEGGRDHLEVTFKKRGAKVAFLDCYCRLFPAISPSNFVEYLKTKKIDLAIFSSAEGVQNFLSLIRESRTSLKKLTLLVASKRIARIVKNEGWGGELIVANNADDESIIKKVVEWHHQVEGPF